MKKTLCVALIAVLLMVLGVALADGINGDPGGAMSKRIDEALKKGISPSTFLNVQTEPVTGEQKQTEKANTTPAKKSDVPTFCVSVITYIDDNGDLEYRYIVEFGAYGYGVPGSQISVVFFDGTTLSTMVDSNGKWFVGLPHDAKMDTTGVPLLDHYQVYQTTPGMSRSNGLGRNDQSEIRDWL